MFTTIGIDSHGQDAGSMSWEQGTGAVLHNKSAEQEDAQVRLERDR
jgi:hypothetical protein